jgi:hypothetical protein
VGAAGAALAAAQARLCVPRPSPPAQRHLVAARDRRALAGRARALWPLGPWRTVASQFYRWVHAGVWETILKALQQQGDAAGHLDWSAHFVDGTVIRAHQHAAGARRIKGGRQSKRSDAAAAASPPSSISGPSVAASPSPCC